MQSKQESPLSLFKDIAPAGSMQISVADYSGDRLELQAPLEPNMNDKGTAFAGSISSMLVLAGWGLITLRLREAGIQADVVVSKSETAYKRPICSDMRAMAAVTSEQIDQLISELKQNPRGSIQIKTKLTSKEKTCATMTATYVAFL